MHRRLQLLRTWLRKECRAVEALPEAAFTAAAEVLVEGHMVADIVKDAP